MTKRVCRTCEIPKKLSEFGTVTSSRKNAEGEKYTCLRLDCNSCRAEAVRLQRLNHLIINGQYKLYKLML